MLLARRLVTQHHCPFTCITRLASSAAQQGYDVIVVGGGHAGTEAAAAATRVGAETLLITQKIQTIGALSCNPSMGGVGKGHLIKEVDALDGLMGRAGDYAGIYFSVLNRSKGPAVWGPRAQLDRSRYKEFIQSELLNTPRLTVIEGSVEDLLVSVADPAQPGKHRVTGVRMADSGNEILSGSVILTTGTFLTGSLFMGQTTSPGGRMGEPPSCAGLSHSLREVLGLKLGRLKTGTPPRIVKETVDFSLTKLQLPDRKPTPFSFINKHTHCKPEEQVSCHLTHTTPGVDRVVRESLHLNSHVQQDTKGPRYCPSLESRVLRFPGRQHQVWLEPEGLNSDLLYPQGLSMTMPPELQLRLIREIPALRQADIHTPGYGVQYDFVCPTQLFPWLQLKHVQGLFLAGQINGTTGYEEAAAQGLWAGVNAGRTSLSLPPLSLSRTESYIGVLIDDLVGGQGVTEPYRMFTSRAEFRMSLRPDNADLRLTPKGFEEIGCVSQHRYQEAVRVRQSLSEALSTLKSITQSSSRWNMKLSSACISEMKSTLMSGEEIMQYQDVSFDMLASVFPDILSPYLEFSERIKIEAVYRRHCEMQQREMERMREEESLSLSPDIDYFSLPVSLSDEVREILDRARPTTFPDLLNISDSEGDDDSEPTSDSESEPDESPHAQSDLSVLVPPTVPFQTEVNNDPIQPKTDGDLHIHSVLKCNHEVMTCQFSNDGLLLAVGLCNGSIKVFRTDSGILTQTLKDSSTALADLPVTGLRFIHSKESRCLLLATYASGSMRCWYVWGVQCVWWLKESNIGAGEEQESRQTLSLSIAPSGDRAVTSGSDSTIHLYDLSTRQRLQVCKASSAKTLMDGHRSRVFAVSFHPEREPEFISGGWDNTVQFWDTRMQHSIRMLYGPHVCGDALHIDPSSNQILTGSWRKYNTLEVWDYNSGRKLSEVPQDTCGDSKIYSCHWFGEEHIVAAGGQENMLRVVDRHSLMTESRLFDLPSAVYSSSVCPSGQWAGLIAASSGNQVFLLQNSKEQQLICEVF